MSLDLAHISPPLKTVHLEHGSFELITGGHVSTAQISASDKANGLVVREGRCVLQPGTSHLMCPCVS